jgi:hypothetical protein
MPHPHWTLQDVSSDGWRGVAWHGPQDKRKRRSTFASVHAMHTCTPKLLFCMDPLLSLSHESICHTFTHPAGLSIAGRSSPTVTLLGLLAIRIHIVPPTPPIAIYSLLAYVRKETLFVLLRHQQFSTTLVAFLACLQETASLVSRKKSFSEKGDGSSSSGTPSSVPVPFRLLLISSLSFLCGRAGGGGDGHEQRVARLLLVSFRREVRLRRRRRSERERGWRRLLLLACRGCFASPPRGHAAAARRLSALYLCAR